MKKFNQKRFNLLVAAFAVVTAANMWLDYLS